MTRESTGARLLQFAAPLAAVLLVVSWFACGPEGTPARTDGGQSGFDSGPSGCDSGPSGFDSGSSGLEDADFTHEDGGSSSPDAGGTIPDMTLVPEACSGLLQLDTALTATAAAGTTPTATGGAFPNGTYVLTSVQIYGGGTLATEQSTVKFSSAGGMTFQRLSATGATQQAFNAAVNIYDVPSGGMAYNFGGSASCSGAQGSTTISIIDATHLTLAYFNRLETYQLAP